ncbi:MAG: YlxR family protein [Eggerthellaceae bacterium]|nr:YlxR family protein [Eggerthellaceae bacterium]
MAMEAKKRQRSCVACGKQEQKGSLHRMVRNADGVVSLDVTGKAAGRGAYVCSAECLAAACKAKKLDRALRVKLGAQDYERLAGEFIAAHGVTVNG